MARLKLYWQSYPLLRWALVHWLTWPLGLLLAALLVQVAGFFGYLLAGAVVGGVVGAGQAYLLYFTLAERRRWILYSALGGLIGFYPATIFAFLGLLSWWIAALLVGLAFGGGLGAMQAWALYRAEEDGVWRWLGVTVAAAIFGSCLAALGILWGIPMWLSPSGICFGLALGYLGEKGKTKA